MSTKAIARECPYCGTASLERIVAHGGLDGVDDAGKSPKAGDPLHVCRSCGWFEVRPKPKPKAKSRGKSTRRASSRSSSSRRSSVGRGGERDDKAPASGRDAEPAQGAAEAAAAAAVRP
jgi:hypothetical protein